MPDRMEFTTYTMDRPMKLHSLMKSVIKVSLLTISVICPARYGAAQALQTDCIGPTSAGRHIVFLHGIMSVTNPANQCIAPPVHGERSLHTIDEWEPLLESIAVQQNIRFAVPHSRFFCRNDFLSLCWGSDDPVSTAASFAAIVTSVMQCFPPGATWGLIGFSNGGYHATRVALLGLAPRPAWVASIGSSGDIKLFANGPHPYLLQVIGREDMTHDKAVQFARDLRYHHMPSSLIDFAGGHEIREDIIREILLFMPPELTP